MATDILDFLAKRRTIRKYEDRPVPEEEIAALIEAAFYAPSYLNRRPMHILVVQDKEKQTRLGEILGVRPYIQQASAVLVLLGDPERSNSWQVDLAASAENVLLAATGMGLGSAWVGNPYGAAWDSRVNQIQELFSIPDSMGVLGLLCVGYPAEEKEPHTKAETWDISRVHYGRFSSLKQEWADVEMDDLSAIEGIDSHIAQVLQENGIFTFEQLAETDSQALQKMLRSEGMLADTSTWPKQARLAADKSWDTLHAFQDVLNGGR
jgi:nitroreductase